MFYDKSLPLRQYFIDLKKKKFQNSRKKLKTKSRCLIAVITLEGVLAPLGNWAGMGTGENARGRAERCCPFLAQSRPLRLPLQQRLPRTSPSPAGWGPPRQSTSSAKQQPPQGSCSFSDRRGLNCPPQNPLSSAPDLKVLGTLPVLSNPLCPQIHALCPRHFADYLILAITAG